MSEPDPIRSALADARAAVAPLIQAPGVAAARSTLHRRRTRRAAVLATSVVVGLGLAAFAFSAPPPPTAPGTEWSAGPTLTGSPAPSPTPSAPPGVNAPPPQPPTIGGAVTCYNKLMPKVENAIPVGRHLSISAWSSGKRSGLLARKLTTNACPTPID